MFQSCLKDRRCLGQMGLRGICTGHFVCARFAIGAHERMWRPWHQRSGPEFDSMGGGLLPDVFRLPELLILMPRAFRGARRRKHSRHWALERCV